MKCIENFIWESFLNKGKSITLSESMLQRKYNKISS